jgi:hypothetical protein
LHLQKYKKISRLSRFFLILLEKTHKKGRIYRKTHKILALFLELSEIILIFAPTESATLPVEQRTRAGLLFYTL